MFGNNRSTGTNVVALATTRGTLSTVTDNNDGTYTATLTSSTSAGTASITGTLDGVAIVSTATVTFTPGPVTHLAVTGPASSTAGTSPSVTVTAKDAFGNTATAYTGTVHLHQQRRQRDAARPTTPSPAPTTAATPSRPP